MNWDVVTAATGILALILYIIVEREKLGSILFDVGYLAFLFLLAGSSAVIFLDTNMVFWLKLLTGGALMLLPLLVLYGYFIEDTVGNKYGFLTAVVVVLAWITRDVVYRFWTMLLVLLLDFLRWLIA